MEFMAGIYFDNRLQLNHYSVCIQLLTQTPHSVQVNIAMERVRAFLYAELCDTVFVGEKDKDKVELLCAMGINVTTLPDEPVDQIIGIMLYCKLNAVMENRMIITKLDIQSTLGDSVWFQFDEDDALGQFNADGWWHKPTCQHMDMESEIEQDKVVRVAAAGWTEYGLDWPEPVPEQGGNTVVFTKAHKNEN